MPLKIKVRPEDFIVKEIADLPLKEKGAFAVYRLSKNNRNTYELLKEISRKFKIPFLNFSYGGRKDRHAQTSQYITIKDNQRFSLKENNYSLEFIGFMDRPMGPGLIKANKFEIVVRNLSVDILWNISLEIEDIGLYGFPNYFDDQRFGSYDSRQGFLAEKILKGQFNGALKIYLTGIYSKDKKEERERREFFFSHWKNWQACLEKAKTNFEKKAFTWLLAKPNSFLDLLKQIPHDELSLFIASYQAYLWNEVLRRLIKIKLPKVNKIYSGVLGEYIFYTRLNDKEYQYFNKLSIPTMAKVWKTNDSLVKDIYIQLLENNGVKNSLFNKLKVRQAFFKSFSRKAIIKPDSLKFSFSDDQIYKDKKAMSLKFSLPSGCYATMLIKRIFSKNNNVMK